MSELVKLSELAELSSVPLRRLRYWARLGRFPIYQIGRLILVRPAEFAQWFDSTRLESKDHAKQEAKSD